MALKSVFKMTRNEMKKAAVTAVAAIVLAVFFYTIFNPWDVPSILTYFIFFILVPSYAVYYVADKLMPEKEKVEVVE